MADKNDRVCLQYSRFCFPDVTSAVVFAVFAVLRIDLLFNTGISAVLF